MNSILYSEYSKVVKDHKVYCKYCSIQDYKNTNNLVIFIKQINFNMIKMTWKHHQ